jgi:hypothetical protein
VPWALDSGGFSVIKDSSGYPQSSEVYAAEVRRWSARIGNLDFAAVQDWMCEPVKLAATGFTVEEHQRRTVQSWLDLTRIAPDLPWAPVLQGFTRAEYVRCAAMYADAGTDLLALPTVGIGSVCRREDTEEAEGIIRELAATGLRLHGFGFKLGGLEHCSDVLHSADSLAWSYGARRKSAAARRHAREAARFAGSLFDTGEAVAVKTLSSDPATALRWLSGVEVAAGMKEEPQLCHPCPWCGSNEVRPPGNDLEWCCAECGESWGDIREPSL